jgi:signal peptidase II
VSSGDGNGPPRWLAPAIVIGIVAADQITKSWVVSALSDRPLSIIGDDVELRVVRNAGGAFSLFTNATLVLALLALIMSVVLVRAVMQARDLWTVVALSLVLGGALGNLSDRIARAPGFLRGHVVDYVHVGPWPSFNVADAAVSIGVVLLLVLTLRHREPVDRRHD